MPSILSAVRRMTRRSPKELPKSQDVNVKQEAKFDYWITMARLLKAAGENLPFPWLKGAADLVLQVLEPLRLARTNQQDFNSLAQDILETLRLIQEQAAALNIGGSSETVILELKCGRFAQALQDMLKDFEAIRKDTLKSSAAVWTTPTMQRLIQSYQGRLQKEVQQFNTSNIIDIHASMYRTEHTTIQIQQTTETLTTRLDAILSPQSKTTAVPALANYRQLLAGDFRVVQTSILASQDSESHVLHQGEKTWKTFRGENSEERWIEEIKFYHTLRLQPHVRQLFGFTESQDFLGLVFHEHSLPVHEAWAEMTPIQRVFADAQFYFDWNEALDSLADISLFRGLVDEINWDGVTQEESGPLILSRSRLLPQADRSGKLHIIFSTDSQDSQPASRYALFSSLSLLKSNQRWVQHFRNAPLSSWKHASTTDILRFYSLVDATASTDTRRYPFSKASTPQFPIRISPFSKAGVTASRSTFPTFNIARWITRYVAVTHLQLSSQSVPLSWSWYPLPPFIAPHEHSNGLKISVPTNTQTVLLNGYCNLAPEEPLYLTALRHIPDIWNSGKRSFKSQCRDIKLEYEYLRGIDLTIEMTILAPQPNPIFLISCAELRLPLDGPLTPQELFYFSADPEGLSRLTELDLSRSGLAITFGSARVVDSRVLSEFAIKAATQVSGSLDSDLVEFPLALQRWPRHLQTRSSSVDRYMKYPNSRIRRYPHPHTFCPPVHSALCDLVTQDECVCSEAKSLLRSAGFTHPYRDSYDPKLHRERCPCYDSSSPAQHKRRRAKSVEKACRVTQCISRWISLMEITEMTQQDIQTWYLEPSFDPIRYRDIPTGPKRSGISPWTVLVDLSEEERGRSPNRRDRD